MNGERVQRLTLDQPVAYQINVPGVINLSEVSWAAELRVSSENDPPTTSIIGVLDQAALHGLLRRIYSMGLPIISVRWIEYHP
jgi:hypothetical protein